MCVVANRCLYSRGDHRLARLDLEIAHQDLCMTLVRFPFGAAICPSNDAIEQSNAFVVMWMWAQTSSDFNVKTFAQGVLTFVQRFVSAQGREAVTMHHHVDIPRGVIEAAWRRTALEEAHGCEGFDVHGLPNGTRIAGSVATSLKASDNL